MGSPVLLKLGIGQQLLGFLIIFHGISSFFGIIAETEGIVQKKRRISPALFISLLHPTCSQ